MFYFHPYLGKIPILTNISQMGWNHQLDFYELFWKLHSGINDHIAIAGKWGPRIESMYGPY